MQDAHGGGGVGAPKVLTIEERAAALRAKKIAEIQASRAVSGDTIIDATRPNADRPALIPEANVTLPGAGRETATDAPVIPDDTRIQKLLGRVKKLEAQMAGTPEDGTVLPATEKTSAAIGLLKQEAKEARRTLADTLKQMGKEDLAALLQSETSPYSIASLKLRASRALAGKTLSALEEIEALSAPARASLEQVAPAPISLLDRVKGGTKDTASTWYNRAKTVGKVVIGTGVINTIGVPAAIALAGVGAMSVAAEACYRTYQKRSNGKEIKGLLPGAEKLAEGMNRLIDNPRQVIADLFFEAAKAVSGETLKLDVAKTERIVQMAKDADKPEVAEQVQTLDDERASVMETLLERTLPMFDGPDSIAPEPFSRTLDLGPDYKPAVPFIDNARTSSIPPRESQVERTLPIAEQVIRGVMAEQRVDAVGDGTMFAESTPAASPRVPMENDPTIPKTMRDTAATFRKIAREGASGYFEISPVTKREMDALDTRFPVADPMDESLKDYLGSITDFSSTIGDKIREIAAQVLAANGDVSAASENIAMLNEMTGEETDYKDFDAAKWAVNRFKKIDEVRALTDKNGVSAAEDPATIALLSKLVNAVNLAREHQAL